MVNYAYKSILYVTLICLSFLAYAESDSSSEQSLPKSGRLASVGVAGSHGAQAEGLWAGDTKSGGGSAPLAASVRKVGSNWIVTVNNKSEDQYSASIKLTQTDVNGRELRRDHMTVSLKAGASTERSFRASSNSIGATVDLNSWDVKKKQPSIEELQEEIDTKKALLEELEAQQE
jgi:hypothetical protein